MKTRTASKQSGNILVIGGCIVVVPLIGIGVGLLIYHVFFSRIVVPSPPPAPMIEIEDSPLQSPVHWDS